MKKTMKESMREELERRNKEIFKKLYTDYMIKLDREYENIVTNGLKTSGIAVNIMYDVVEKLVYETIEKIDNLVNEIKSIFEPIPLNDLKEYIERCEKNISGHIDGMQNKILEKFKDDKLLNVEILKQKLNNIKENSNYKLNQIYLKNKNIESFKKIEVVVIINTIATVGSFIIAIISLFIR